MRSDPDQTSWLDEDVRFSLCDACGNSFLPVTRIAGSSAVARESRLTLGRRTILKIFGALPVSLLLWWYGPTRLARPGRRAMFSRKIGS